MLIWKNFFFLNVATLVIGLDTAGPASLFVFFHPNCYLVQLYRTLKDQPKVFVITVFRYNRENLFRNLSFWTKNLAIFCS